MVWTTKHPDQTLPQVTSRAPSSPTRSPRRLVYFVQSPSRDSHDGEKTTMSFHSSPVLRPMVSPPILTPPWAATPGSPPLAGFQDLLSPDLARSHPTTDLLDDITGRARSLGRNAMPSKKKGCSKTKGPAKAALAIAIFLLLFLVSLFSSLSFL
ncbi:hypothetical protein F0562_027538 [Nyssa sinensis]|uniref:Uncharacterized protein n=1 Tax=Nyssa sinensis TaxID=561372 RepID=A0A5J5B7M2_9ASTE|nr:hypothetical protein F0562_027538 [Nyssa sinensis]